MNALRQLQADYDALPPAAEGETAIDRPTWGNVIAGAVMLYALVAIIADLAWIAHGRPL